MKFEMDETGIRVTLSERNLLALLVKLRHQPCSARTLSSRNSYMDGKEIELPFTVHAESDAEHYQCRKEPPGLMQHETEALLALIDSAVSMREEPH